MAGKLTVKVMLFWFILISIFSLFLYSEFWFLNLAFRCKYFFFFCQMYCIRSDKRNVGVAVNGEIEMLYFFSIQ